MTILALEFSSPQRSVAVLQGGADAGPLALGEAIEAGTRSTNALGLVEEALRQAQLDREQIECLAVGLGPGSYTGIRLAIALAQGWQLARPVQLLGVSSAECLAAQAQAEGIFGRVEVVIDAQRNEFYLAGYDLSAESRREIEPLRLVAAAEVQARQQAGGHHRRPGSDQLVPGQPRPLSPRRDPRPTGPWPDRLYCRREAGADLPARNPLRQSPATANPPFLNRPGRA